MTMNSRRMAIPLAAALALAVLGYPQDAPEQPWELPGRPGVMVSPGSAAAREPRVDPEAEKAAAAEVLDALEKKYQALETYHIRARKVSSLQRTRVEEVHNTWMERDADLGPRWRTELDIVRQLENIAPSSTRTVNVSLHDESWTENIAGGSHRVIRSLPTKWNSHFDMLRRALSAQINSVSVTGEEEILGQTATVIQVARGPERRRIIQRYWLCNETGLLLKETQEYEGRTDEARYTVEAFETNRPIDESVWNYTPPEGVEVMDLREKQQAPPRAGEAGIQN